MGMANVLNEEKKQQVLARMSHRGGRVAAESSSSRRRRQVKIRKSSYGPSSAVLLAVLAPRVPIFGQGKTHHSPRLGCAAQLVSLLPPSQQRRAATCNCRCTWRNSSR